MTRSRSTADEIRAALVKSPLQADAIAKKHGLSAVSVENVAMSDPIPELGVAPELTNALSSMQKGEVSPVVQAGPTRLAIAVLKNIVPLRPAELNEVEARVKQSVIGEKASALAKQKSVEVAEKVKNSGGDLKAVAKSLGLEVKTTAEFGRDGAAEGIGPASYLQEAFVKPVGTLLSPVVLGDQTHFVKVIGRVDADLAKLATERDSMVLAIKSRKARERDELFRDGVLSELMKEGKVKIHEDVIKRIVAGYSRS